MEITPFVPVIVEATKFMFGEVAKWIDHARQKSVESVPASNEVEGEYGERELTQQDFVALQSNVSGLESMINAQAASTNAYVIKELVNQIQIHQKNLVDLETTEAIHGALTPAHIKRQIETEADSIVKKSYRLKGLLEKVYEKRIELS